MFVYGCKQGVGLDKQTKFGKNIIDLLQDNFDLTTGEIVLPDVFTKIVSEDAVFETAQSCMSQRLVIERNDDMFGKVFIFYLTDEKFPKDARKEF